jgi:hypothetical protein
LAVLGLLGWVAVEVEHRARSHSQAMRCGPLGAGLLRSSTTDRDQEARAELAVPLASGSALLGHLVYQGSRVHTVAAAAAAVVVVVVLRRQRVQAMVELEAPAGPEAMGL